MSFESILQSVIDDCRGALAIALMGADGIPVAEAQSEEVHEDGPVADIATAGIEFGRILGEIAKASDALGGGSLSETVISLARFTLIFRAVDEELILIMALAPDGNLGKARYLMRRHLIAIRQEL